MRDPRGAKILNLMGKRFGRLTVIGGPKLDKSIHKSNRMWLCRCRCGGEKWVLGSLLSIGRTKSCGCIRKEKTRSLSLKRGRETRSKMKGRKFGLLKAIRECRGRVNGHIMLLCKCDCGNKIKVPYKPLKQGNIKSCGCLKSSTRKLKGRRFGSLKVIDKTEERKNGYVIWLCKCDCGKEAKIRTSSLTSGNTKSCGCTR